MKVITMSGSEIKLILEVSELVICDRRSDTLYLLNCKNLGAPASKKELEKK